MVEGQATRKLKGSYENFNSPLFILLFFEVLYKPDIYKHNDPSYRV